MKKNIISVIGLGALTNIGCSHSTEPPISNPPNARIESDSSIGNSLPTYESIQAPEKGYKAELIVTESGCFKNWVPEGQPVLDRFEEKGKGTKIECPERAKDITKKSTSEPPERIRTNPPRPPKEPSEE